MPWVAGRYTQTTGVPKLVGLKMDQAKEVINDSGLAIVLDTASDFSAEIPAGKIMSQFPDAGTTVKTGRRVWVKISRGRRALEVPLLRGLSLRQAEISLQQAGLRVGGGHQLASPDAPSGAVLGSSPAAKTVVERGRYVSVDVSSGADTASRSIPSLLGLSLSQARNQLQAMGIPVGEVIQRPDAGSLPQTVLSQTPAPGTPVKGDPVDLVVSE